MGHFNTRAFSRVQRFALMTEGAIRNDTSGEGDDNQSPIGPDRSPWPPEPGIFACGALLFGLGVFVVYRSQFIDERPDVAFALLAGWGLIVLLVVALLLAWLG